MASFVSSNEVLTPAQAGAVWKYPDSRSRVAEADINPGLFVTIGTDAENEAKVPTSIAEVADGLGFVRLIVTKEATGAGGEVFAAGDVLDVVYNGFIWAVAEELMAPGDPVYVRYSGGTPGAVRNDDPGTAASLVAGLSVEKVHSASLVLLKVNL